MLSTRSALATLRPPLRAARISSRRLPHRRTIFSSTVHTLSEGFLDLAIALPFPPEWPPYSCTIILVTIVTRLAFTVPFSVWVSLLWNFFCVIIMFTENVQAKNRQWRAENVAVPQLKREMPDIHKQVQQEMRKGGFRGTKEAIVAEINKRARPIAAARRKALLAQHHASPIPTIALPIVTQLPLFVGTSMVLSHATSTGAAVLDAEAFCTLTSLTHADATATLPILLGVVTLANVETARWFASAEALEREERVAAWTRERRARGEQVVEPRKVYQTALRIMSVGRILIAAMVPGGIQLYWLTSATFGLFQTWALDYWDMRRRRSRIVSGPSPLKGPPPPA